MRHYFIYLLKPEIASNYFGKESLIYQLFLEGESATVQLKPIIEKQVNYIIRTMPVLQIKKLVETSFKNRHDYYVSNDQYFINSKTLQSKAVLTVHQHMLSLSVTGSYHAETVFFEVLRKYDSCFFAMDFENSKYGWLTPVKQVKYV